MLDAFLNVVLEVDAVWCTNIYVFKYKSKVCTIIERLWGSNILYLPKCLDFKKSMIPIKTLHKNTNIAMISMQKRFRFYCDKNENISCAICDDPNCIVCGFYLMSSKCGTRGWCCAFQDSQICLFSKSWQNYTYGKMIIFYFEHTVKKSVENFEKLVVLKTQKGEREDVSHKMVNQIKELTSK